MSMSRTAKVWFHRSRAVAWVLLGVASYVFGFASNVSLVWAASVYANTVSDWGAAEAADDRAVTSRIDHLEQLIHSHTTRVTRNVSAGRLGWPPTTRIRKAAHVSQYPRRDRPSVP